MRILIVEDNVDIAQGLQETLRQEGYAADIAGNLAQAWGVLTSEPVDAVLLDLGLPDGDGLTLLARVRGLRPGQVVLDLEGIHITPTGTQPVGLQVDLARIGT